MNDTYNITFRNNLYNLIYGHGLTARSFSRALGISTATISRYLGGQRIPDIDHLIKIASYFNVSIDWLVGFVPASNPILDKYNLATPDDKLVIETILGKYAELD